MGDAIMNNSWKSLFFLSVYLLIYVFRIIHSLFSCWYVTCDTMQTNIKLLTKGGGKRSQRNISHQEFFLLLSFIWPYNLIIKFVKQISYNDITHKMKWKRENDNHVIITFNTQVFVFTSLKVLGFDCLCEFLLILWIFANSLSHYLLHYCHKTIICVTWKMISLFTVIIIMLSTITIKLLTIIIKLYKYAKKKPFYGQVTTNYNVFGLPQIMLVITHQCLVLLYNKTFTWSWSYTRRWWGIW